MGRVCNVFRSMKKIEGEVYDILKVYFVKRIELNFLKFICKIIIRFIKSSRFVIFSVFFFMFVSLFEVR